MRGLPPMPDWFSQPVVLWALISWGNWEKKDKLMRAKSTRMVCYWSSVEMWNRAGLLEIADGIMRKGETTAKLTEYEKKRNKKISKKRYIACPAEEVSIAYVMDHQVSFRLRILRAEENASGFNGVKTILWLESSSRWSQTGTIHQDHQKYLPR